MFKIFDNILELSMKNVKNLILKYIKMTLFIRNEKLYNTIVDYLTFIFFIKINVKH